jgi:hypothetical protein
MTGMVFARFGMKTHVPTLPKQYYIVNINRTLIKWVVEKQNI